MNKKAPVHRLDLASLVGVPLTIVVLAGAQWLEGGKLKALVQPTAALVVFGGTLAALLVSFPAAHLMNACRALRRAFGAPPPPSHQMIQQFTQYAVKAKRKGTMALEAEIAKCGDSFTTRALSLMVDGFEMEDVRRTLETDSRRLEEVEETSADVLEAAAGYSPTLGILGAVLGLIHVMENLSAPTKLGSGIAVAFVATVYGVGAANLLFLPLATKLRGVARTARLTREIVIEGTSAIQRGVHPRLLEHHLSGYVRAHEHKNEKPPVAAA
jgi:chemotaxis protein MotA